jgi:hypothetical protein
MLLLKKPKARDPDPTMPQRTVIDTQIHTGTNTPIKVGEYVIIKVGPLVPRGTAPRYPELRGSGSKSITTPPSPLRSATTTSPESSAGYLDSRKSHS